MTTNELASQQGRAMKLHRGKQFENRFGGTTFTTLCGRMNAACDDGMNIADTDEQVTCKFCIRKMEQRP